MSETNQKPQGEYEAAWQDGEGEAAPAENAARKAAEAEAERQRREFSEAFFADENQQVLDAAPGETLVEKPKVDAEPGQADFKTEKQ